MPCHHVQNPTFRKIVTTLLLFCPLAGAAILYGESLQQSPAAATMSAGVFWPEGRNWWAPDYGQCNRCGGKLVARIDQLGACRYCAPCNLTLRHHTMPTTLEEQVWTQRGEEDVAL
jgi:hypothetical protein